MSGKHLSSPARGFSTTTLVDWLEFTAFFDDFSESRIDQIESAFKVQEDEFNQNIADSDAEIEQLRAEIEIEISSRSTGLKEAYPFKLSHDGEVLSFKERGDRGGSLFYLFCLIMSHATRSEFLQAPPAGNVLSVARNKYFQALAVMAMAGHTGGPAIWLGWPRQTDEGILAVVQRACDLAETGSARAVPAETASEYDKDSGIDILSWSPANDRPPPTSFHFGQTASGHDWDKKSAVADGERLLRNYFDVRPHCQFQFVTICPHRLEDKVLRRHHFAHGAILDRTRAPLQALYGYRMSRLGVQVDAPNLAARIWHWIYKYKRNPRGEVYNAA